METGIHVEQQKATKITKLEKLIQETQNTENPSITINDGEWDSNKRTYTISDSEGVTTEIKLTRAPATELGNVAKETSYKTEDGKKIEVQFDTASNTWKPSKGNATGLKLSVMPKHTATVEDKLSVDGSVMHVLRVEPYKIKGIPRKLTTPVKFR